MGIGELLGVIGAIATGVFLGLHTPLKERGVLRPVPIPVHDEERVKKK